MENINLFIVLFLLCWFSTINATEEEEEASTCVDDHGKEYLHGQQIEIDCNTCTCLDFGWSCTEEACSDPCFHSPCQNGGLCMKRSNSRYQCICTKEFTGQECSEPLPEGACNNGRDTYEDRERIFHYGCLQYCECNDGLISCDHESRCPEVDCPNPVYSPNYCCPICWPEEKPGYCPGTSLSDTGTCEESCRYDVNCTGDQKCCFNGCGLSCMDSNPGPTTLCASYPCKNGGTCLDILATVFICQCSPGYHGELCELKDAEPCFHDGVWYRDGQAETESHCYKCVCNDGFFECHNRCAKKPGNCPDDEPNYGFYSFLYYFDNYNFDLDCSYDSDCPNHEKCCGFKCILPEGGTPCVYNGVHLKSGESYHDTCHFCICERGKMHCDDSNCVIEKPGTCPPVDDAGICVKGCTDDSRCPGIEKCCYNGCADVCVSPLEANATSACYFEGDWYSEGELESKENHCGNCFCSEGTVLCRSPICPETDCYYDAVYVQGECCPICIDEETHVGECSDISTNEPGALCQSNCDHDDYCDSDEKCCPTSCGSNVCVKAVNLGHPGMCPFLVYNYYNRWHSDNCQHDDHCALEEKCCHQVSGEKICSQSIDEGSVICDDQPCQNGGTCDVHESNSFVYVCTCAPGFIGDNCEYEELCYVSPNPCENGGRCTLDPDSPCVCNQGFTGSFCEDACNPSICQNGGTCNGRSYYPCECPLGFSGRYCQTDECALITCMNNGTCSGRRWEPCYCPYGYSGDYCEREDRCGPHVCKNGGTCKEIYDSDSPCSCPLGFSGPFCDHEISWCDSDPCLNGGICVDYWWYSHCSCAEGFKGEFCEDVELCASVSCDHGYCTLDYGYYSRPTNKSHPCTCYSGYVGTYCDTEIVYDCEGLFGQACQNGGTCRGEEWYTPCRCLSGYTGDFCEEEECYWCYDSSIESYSYNWYGSGGHGSDQSNPCQSNPCLNHGRCHRVYYYYWYSGYSDGFYCDCPPGFKGDTCAKNNTCNANYCLNGGTCVGTYPTTDRGYSSYCVCPHWVRGDICQIVSPCKSAPCHNGGTCKDYNSEYFFCECPRGTSGEHCEILHDDVCEHSPCLNYGSCAEFRGVAVCFCPVGYSGRFCEIEIQDFDDYHCLFGALPDACLFDPCIVSSCPKHPHARCKSNYCGCRPEFYDENGDIVDCHECPAENVVTCVINPCDVIKCDSHPSALCEASYCGACRANFYDTDGNSVDCLGDKSCEYNGQIYEIDEQRDHEDACNTCTCTDKNWECTVKKCSERVVVEMIFSLELDYRSIMYELQEFKNEIIGQLALKFKIGENNFKDVKIFNGSVIVEFKLVNEDDIDPEAVSDNIFEQLESGDVMFTYKEKTISVMKGSVKEPRFIDETEEDEETGDEEAGDEKRDSAVVIIAVCVVVIVFVVTIVVGMTVYLRRRTPKPQDTAPLHVYLRRRTPKPQDTAPLHEVKMETSNNPYAELDKTKVSDAVVYDNLSGAKIKNMDNPTYGDIASEKE